MGKHQKLKSKNICNSESIASISVRRCDLCKSSNSNLLILNCKTIQEVLLKYKQIGPSLEKCNKLHKRFSICGLHYKKGNLKKSFKNFNSNLVSIMEKNLYCRASKFKV